MTTLITTQRAGVVAHALRALADHIEAHHLPEPGSIEIEADHLEFHIQSGDALVWATSLGESLDRFDETPHDGTTVTGCRVEGRLPDSGVKVAIEWVWVGRLRPVPREAVSR